MNVNYLSATSSKSLLAGLLGYWKLDEASGDTAYDSYGSNNLTRANNATLGAVAKLGLYAVDFSGAGGTLAIPAATFGTKIYDKWSISFWLKIDTLASVEGAVIYFTTLRNTTASMRVYLFQDTDNKIYASTYDYTGTYYRECKTNAAITDTTNYMHVVVMSEGIGGYIRLYINNSLGTSNSTIVNHFDINGESYLGHANTYCFDGRIDEYALWNRTLTTTEIAALYNSGSGLAYPF